MRCRSLVLAAVLGAASLAAPRTAPAFCGFYVSQGDTRLTNDATMTVLMREGQRTVLSMQNNYKGPPSDFAMVVPVPVVLQKENVRTLPREVFDRVDLMASPRLVEYWEQDPCPAERPAEPPGAFPRKAAAAPAAARAEAKSDLGVRVEAEFTVGEYEVVVLSARDSDGLDTWLRENRYQIPEGAEPVLRPYVAKGMKFFVARVNASKVKFENGEAVLSPLRFHYDSDDFGLPVRLGLLNSGGKQEIVVHVLARGKRYEVANYPNVTIPTNYDVSEEAREKFGPFYAALFDATMEKHPGAVVTEYAWDAQSCDPCPGPTLGASDILTLGADALGTVTPPPNLLTDPNLRPQVTVGGIDRGAKGSVEERKATTFERNVDGCYRAELPRAARPEGRIEILVPPDVGRVPPNVGRAKVPTWVGPNRAVPPLDVKTKRSGSLTASLETCVGNIARRLAVEPKAVAVTVDLRLVPAAPGEGWWKAPPVNTWGFTLTRLHTRYGKDGLGQDLLFREAPPIVGGREDFGVAEQDHGAKPGGSNNFQARYAIRHPWTGPITCASPKRGVWGGPPAGQAGDPSPKSAPKIAYVPRGQVQLASLVRQSIPDLGIQAPPAASAGDPLARGGCGCALEDRGGPILPGTLAVGAALLLRARRRARVRAAR
jgi:hypothetical protein